MIRYVKMILDFCRAPKKLDLGKAARKFCLPWADNFSGPLPIEQVAMKSYLLGRKKLLVPKDWTVLISSSDF